jgi:Uma2 family endonuclease
MSLQVEKRLFSVADYYKMAKTGVIKQSDRVELIKGEIVERSPANSPHAGVVNELAEKLILALHGKATIAVQNPLSIDRWTETEPDLVVAKYRKDKYRKRHPRPKDVYLVIEVSDSSLLYDRQVKAPLYAGAGIPEYWIANLSEQRIEIFRNPEDGAYKVQLVKDLDDTAICEALEFSLPVKAVFP